MTVHEWRKVKRLFSRASKLPRDARAAYLDRLCGGDVRLRREVEELLAQDEHSTAFLGVLSSTHGRLAHYTNLERIGEGAMGLVYKALDTRLGRTVAIKALPPWASGSTTLRDRLVEEARFAAALNHPNIVTVFEILREAAGDFIVMEYLVGKTLQEIIPPSGLPKEEALSYALPLADALSEAHSRGILHGDIKPSNVFVTDRGRVKLLDFGLAAAANLTAHSSDQSPLRGTAAYMAPERVNGEPADPRADVFSFGVLLWEMLTPDLCTGCGMRAVG